MRDSHGLSLSGGSGLQGNMLEQANQGQRACPGVQDLAERKLLPILVFLFLLDISIIIADRSELEKSETNIKSEKVNVNRSLVSSSLRPHGL